VHGQRGLADARRAADRRDHHRPVDVPALADDRVQLRQVRHPPGEAVDVGRQLRRHQVLAAVLAAHRLGALLAGRAGHVLAEHPQVGRAQLGARLDTQLVDQAGAQRGEQPQRGRLLPGRGHGQHDSRVQPFVERLGVADRPEQLHGRLRLAEPHGRVPVGERGRQAPAAGGDGHRVLA
jgi:hypothetical protein